MNELPRVSYEPSKKKRFEISEDEYSRERLATIKSFYERMQESFGVSMGIVLFGSLAKGKKLNNEIKDSSDVDFTLFVDIDEYRKLYIENLRNNKLFSEFEIRRLDGICHGAPERRLLRESSRKIQEGRDLSHEEQAFFENKFQKFNESQFIFFLAAWHGYVDFSGTSSDGKNFSFRGKREYPIERIQHLLKVKDIQAWPIQMHGEFSIKNQVQRVADLLNNPVEDNHDRQMYILDQERCGIARIFGLDVGGGMKIYRQAFV